MHTHNHCRMYFYQLGWTPLARWRFMGLRGPAVSFHKHRTPQSLAFSSEQQLTLHSLANNKGWSAPSAKDFKKELSSLFQDADLRTVARNDPFQEGVMLDSSTGFRRASATGGAGPARVARTCS